MSTHKKILVERFHDFDALEPLQNEWDKFMESIHGEIFLTFDWCRTWWKYYGDKRKLAVFVFRDETGLCAIMPLFCERLSAGPLSVDAVRMVGTDFMPVSMALPVRDGCVHDVIDTLIGEINAVWRWDILHLGALSGGYAALPSLVHAFQSRLGDDYLCQLKEADVQTYFPVAGDWDKQLASLSSKQRANIRRAFRETDRQGVRIGSRLASGDTLSAMFDGFVAMHQKHWRGMGNAGHFGAWPSAEEFHREIAGIQLGRDRLRLIEIDFDGLPAGYEYIYRFDDSYCWFLNARSEFRDNKRIDFKWISYRIRMECALNDGVKTIDGLRGFYDYKILLGGEVLPTHHLYVYSRRFPSIVTLTLFRMLATLIDIVYHKIWRRRVVPRLGCRVGSFWKFWIRSHTLSS